MKEWAYKTWEQALEDVMLLDNGFYVFKLRSEENCNAVLGVGPYHIAGSSRAWTDFGIPSSKSLPPCDLPLQTEDCFVHDGLTQMLQKAPLVLSRQWFNQQGVAVVQTESQS